ncbi:MAG TPA: cytochrome c oxidase subunit II [Solirubrobacteraceae bacterium]|nr:cytochrome c oxidase subunit II [Solirubrobacteraceae bacterium]
MLVIRNALVTTRGQYDHLFAIYVPIAGGVFALIVIVVLASVLRYRRRAQPARWSESNRLEISYAGLLVLTASFLIYLTLAAENKDDTVANHERPAVTVDVTAAKREWDFRYHGDGIVIRSGTVGRQPLFVPVGEAIRFNLASQDVIHALWIPAVRFKRDLIPGTVEHVTLTFTQAGLFPGQCAEFCGLRHADMVFNVRAVAPAVFRRWVQAHATAVSS